MAIQLFTPSVTEDTRVTSDRAWRRSRSRPGRGWLRLVSPVVLIGIWQLLSATGVLPASRLASPASVAHTAYNLVVTDNPAYGTLQGSLLVPAERWGIGFSVGVLVAVTIAIASGLSRIGEYAPDPLMNAPRAVPLLGLLPLFIVWFGIGGRQ